MEEMKGLLEEEIRAQLRDLKSLPSASTEKSEAIDDIVALYKLKMEEEKTELERTVRQSEEDWKICQRKELVKDRYFRVGIEAAGIVLPLMFYAYWMKKGLKFEEEGTFTSTTFRGLISRFRPTGR